MEGKFAKVCIDISHEKVDRPFQYKVPHKLRDVLYPGVQVLIPFGKGDRQRKGFVLSLTDESDYPEEKCKEIIDVAEGGISVEGRYVALAAWMKEHYGSTLIAALKTVLPVKEQVRSLPNREIRLAVSREEREGLLEEAYRKHHEAKARLLEAFEHKEVLPYGFVITSLGVGAKTLQAMEKKGSIVIRETDVYRNPVRIGEKEVVSVSLSDEQKEIVDSFSKDYRAGILKTYLLHGVTGSGKTEVYMEMIQTVLDRGKEVIVLIPEIALTYQTVLRFYKRFGDRISIMHSRLSKGERYDQFERAKKGQIQIMIGARSALFTPFTNLGLIIIDEEHESSYKSDSMPKYHARETAEYMGKQWGASIVLGSATPSVTSYYRAQTGQYGYFKLAHRFGASILPAVHTVDLRKELREGNKSIFSRLLAQKLQDRLSKGQQAMLFLNRRGYAGFVTCRSCGYVAKCPHCDVSLTEHGKTKLVCHYCGYERAALSECPACGSPYIAGFQVGTEQVEERLLQLFPKARVLRMDKDTTKKKDDYEKILSAFSERKADILIGTQMIVKGHDFPGVTLVGVLAADLSLSVGDYRAGERTFQLITQAVGRAGRGKEPGEAVIQTYRPEHYGVVHAAKQDYEGFYEEEIAYRKVCSYPPVSHMLAILLSSSNKEKAEDAAKDLAKLLRENALKEKGADAPVSVIGPADASIGKISDSYRKMIYIRHNDYQDLIKTKDLAEKAFDEDKETYGSCSIYFDFDPMNGY
ncbi:MAG: primosomal protein N' [Lachnospiraceae bacterium]|nr:primosomal protein N' [Lachnospiraceae bacterium]